MKCKKCKMDIPKGAKVCPYCRCKQGMGGGAVALIVIGVIILLSIAASAANSAMKGYNDAARGNSVTSSNTEVPQVSREEYIAGCSEIAYEDLARNPDKYKGRAFTFTGKVIQVAEPTYGDTVSLRINVTKGEYSWSDTVYATVELPKSADRILEDDIITIYGDCDGLFSYKSIIGSQVSVPSIKIRYFRILDDESAAQTETAS